MDTSALIRGRVDIGILQKADRLFRNDDKGTFIEILQNARRAGATRVNVTLEEIPAEPTHCVVTVEDNGIGIESFQHLVTLGRSGWDQETQDTEDPAGMGFFSLCQSGVEVTSLSKTVTLSRDVFLGNADAEVKDHVYIAGTRLRFTRPSTRLILSAVLASVAKFCPLDVCLNGEILPQHDFLEGSIYREEIDGIEVGFATKFEHNFTGYRDDNWNFYGSLIHESFSSFAGTLSDDHKGLPLALHVRFNVRETGRIKLQLPDRRSVIESEFLLEFKRKATAAAYRCFQQQAQHALPYRNWKEAFRLGIQLKEAACLLTTWSVSARDDDMEPLFGYGETKIVSELDEALLVRSELTDQYTFQAALNSGAKIDFVLYEEKSEYQGYCWYDRLPRLTDVEVLLDGVLYVECTKDGIAARPKTIELKITIEEPEQDTKTVSVPALVHVDTEDEYGLDPIFVVIQDSPWDKGNVEPFSLHEFLMWATFWCSDDVENDSWQTQCDRHGDFVTEIISRYLHGPRASLISQLRRSLDSSITHQAEQLGVTEIKFSRSSSGGWTTELNGAETNSKQV
jgi:Histidine kinase-, DNA gyrase B-, and HSP90-like ATPase